MSRRGRPQQKKTVPRSKATRDEEKQQLRQAESTLSTLRKKKTWPVKANIWIPLYKNHWGVVLKKGDPAYTKIMQAYKNDTYQRNLKKKKQQQEVDEEE